MPQPPEKLVESLASCARTLSKNSVAERRNGLMLLAINPRWGGMLLRESRKSRASANWFIMKAKQARERWVKQP